MLFACCLEASGSCSVLFVSGAFSKALEVYLKWVIEKEGREPLQEKSWYKQLDSENMHSTIAKLVLAETVVQKVIFPPADTTV